MAIGANRYKLPLSPRRIFRSQKNMGQADFGDHRCPDAVCVAYAFGICASAQTGTGSDTPRNYDPAAFESSARTVPPREIILHPKEWQDFAPVICSGWAIYSIVDRDARRQIISFLLPGDVVSTTWLWDSSLPRMVQALTHVIYRQIKRNAFKARLFDNPHLVEIVAKFRNAELAHCEELAFILGRHSGEERIARLILHLSGRLAARGMMQGQLMEFPLRQRDIADATGLSTDYVNRTMKEFQRSNLIAVKDGMLEILNNDELRCIG